LTIESNYEEINHLATVTVDGVSYGAGDGYDRFENSGRVILRNSVLLPVDINDTSVMTYDMTLTGNEPNLTGNSVLVHHAPMVDTGSVVINQYCVNPLSPFAARLLTYQGPLTSNPTWGYANLIAHGSCAAPFTPTDVNGLTYSFAYPGPVFGNCLRITNIPKYHDTDDRIRPWPNVTTTLGKFYVWSVDIKSADANDGHISLYQGGRFQGQGIHLEAGRWKRYWGLFEGAGGTAGLYLYSTANNLQSVDLADLQLVQFDTAQEAYEYAHGGLLAVGTDVPCPCLAATALTNDYAVVAATDNGKTFTMAVNKTIEMCPATPGQKYRVLMIDTNDVMIDPNASQFFRGQNTGKYLRLDDKGCSVTFECLTTGIWDITSSYDPNTGVANRTFQWQP